MKTLIFNGSPRSKGDTASLLKIFTEHLEGEYRIVNAYRCGIRPCIDCRFCWKNEGCSIQDEMQEIYEYLKDCDNVLIASPLYFSELTGPLLSVGSRLQTYYCARCIRRQSTGLKPKRGAVILVGGGDGRPNRAFETAKVLLHDMNVKQVFEPIVSHSTDRIPAAENADAVKRVKELAGEFGRPLKGKDISV